MKTILTMNKNKKLFAAIVLSAFAANSFAQSPSGADYLQAMKKANVNVVFDVNSEGEPFHIKWGMDTAWDWDWNVIRGVNYYGKGLFETGRISFQPNDLVTDNGDGTYKLTNAQQKALQSRINHIKLTGTTEVNINCDHEALNDRDGKAHYQGKPEEWYKLIKATVQYTQAQGLKVVSVSPFNESDYTSWNQYKGTEANGMKDFLAIAKLIKADPFFDDIRVCGGNTLNCDRALPWYDYLKGSIDEGNTHQLAGSFDTYANFFTQVKNDGKVATADELHNVGEAIVGVQYGMETGIWWGFDALARGQFMHDSNEGVRLAYAENRSAWTTAAVYRNDETHEVHGYFGSSERQASPCSYAYISKSKDVYFNGYGPTRVFVCDVPGGNGYQKGQINAERVFDITWGEDVAPGVIDGTYQIMNASSRKMLTWNSTSNVKSSNRKSSGTTQQWKVQPGYTAGDVSFWFIDNNNDNSTKINLNVLNNNLNSGAGVICWDANHDAVEQWYLKYVKDGYYFIISRLSNKYLYCSSNSDGTDVKLQDAPTAATTEAVLKRYLWRFQPIDAKAETVAPNAPSIESVKENTGSVELTWSEVEDDDPLTYIVIRGEEGNDGMEWNTIARDVKGTTYIDNTAIAGKSYSYKVKAVDYAGNRSEASEEAAGKVKEGQALICQLQFDKDMTDKSANQFNAAVNGTVKYSTSLYKKSGTAGAQFDGTAYAMLQNSVANLDEMTIAMWVNWGGSGNWQRVFDFGNDESQYMFFTPSNGSQMRFVMNNGDGEQVLTNGKKLATAWKHVAVTLKPLDNGNVQAVLYVDGENVAESNEFTIKPSDIKPALCYIGRSMFNSDPYFNGRLDDFRIYNYALTPEQIQDVMTDLDEVSKHFTTAPSQGEDPDVDTSIKDVDMNAASAVYDLSGRKVEAAKGINISNGKKVYVK